MEIFEIIIVYFLICFVLLALSVFVFFVFSIRLYLHLLNNNYKVFEECFFGKFPSNIDSIVELNIKKFEYLFKQHELDDQYSIKIKKYLIRLLMFQGAIMLMIIIGIMVLIQIDHTS